MKYIKFLVALTTVFYMPLTLKSQDSTSIHDLFYKKQQQSLSLLSGWSVGNLIYSPLATNNIYFIIKHKTTIIIYLLRKKIIFLINNYVYLIKVRII